jgi:hypothetical protein
MHTPYASDFLSCFMAAQWGAAVLLLAVVLFARLPAPSKWALMGAIALAAIALTLRPMLDGIGHRTQAHFFWKALETAVALTALGAILAVRPVAFALALLSLYPLWKLCSFVANSDAELAALALAWIGLLVGLVARRAPTADPSHGPSSEDSYLLHDAAIFALATLLAALVGWYVMDRRDGSADEWAYAFQAATFAKGHAYSEASRCQRYLQNYWVFEKSGRLFSQYTPGWPFFMVPFVWIRKIWISGPFSMGFMAWGMARLGRSAMRQGAAGEEGPGPALIRASGTWAAAVAMLGTSILENGGSRYSHVFMTGLYAWSLEGLFMASSAGLSKGRQTLWGTVFGSACAMMVATRPAEGALLGLGIAMLFVYGLVRGRVPWRALLAAAAGFAFWSLLTLVVLRLQIGQWFATGYSIAGAVKYSRPQSNEWKYGIPLATGAYCWWPCSMPLGLAGIAMFRGRALGLATAFAVSGLALLTYFSYLEFGRGYDWGYGPRYEMELLVPMAIGSGFVLSRFAVSASGRMATPGPSAFSRGGPLAISLLAIAMAWLRIVPQLWPAVYDHTHQHSGVNRAIEDEHVTHAVVLAEDGTTGFSDLDLTTNLPVDLYPDQDVIIAVDRREPAQAFACLSAMFPGRRFYKASGSPQVNLTPFR